MNGSAPAPKLPADRVLIGRLGAVHGLRGEVKLFSLSDVPGRFAGLTEVGWFGPTGASRQLRICGLRPIGNDLLIRFEGFDTPEAARVLVNGVLTVPSGERAALPGGTYYLDDVIGCDVVTEQGRSLGTVTEIYQTGANDVYEVRDPAGRETLLPAVADVVLAVDVAARRLVVRPPDGSQE
jgi:16S rRNA processing protein RimM